MDNQQHRLHGQWIELEPLDESNYVEVVALHQQIVLTPEMGGMKRQSLEFALPEIYTFGMPLVIRVQGENKITGLLSHGPLEGYDGVHVTSSYTKNRPKRLNITMEAIKLFFAYLFQEGTQKIHIEIIGFNKPMLKIMQIIGLPMQARLRQHVYIAGQFWDVLVFGCSKLDWPETKKRFDMFLPNEQSSLSTKESARRMINLLKVAADEKATHLSIEEIN